MKDIIRSECVRMASNLRSECAKTEVGARAYDELKRLARDVQRASDDDDGREIAAFVSYANANGLCDVFANEGILRTMPGRRKREKMRKALEARSDDEGGRREGTSSARSGGEWETNRKIERLSDGLVCVRKFMSAETQAWLVRTAFEVGESDVENAALGRGFFTKSSDGDGLRLNQGTRGRVIKKIGDFPDEFRALCAEAVAVARGADALVDPSVRGFNPTTVLVNFYTAGAEFKWHKDSEDPRLIASKTGPPIVSFSVGLSADFGYKHSFEDPEHKVVRLNSGDVLLFGGPSRMIVHSVLNVHPGSMPGNLRGKMLNGRLNVTVRDVGTGVIDESQFPAYRVYYDGVQAEGNV